MGKNSEFFSSKKIFSINCSPGHLLLFCQPWKMFSAVVPKISKTIQKSSRFQDLLSEMLLCNWSSEHVESSFDKPAKKIPVKIHVFLVKVQKRRKTVRSTVNFSTFFLCTLRLLFRHTWLFFCQNQKKLTQSPKKDDNSKYNFCHFFSRFCWGHVKCPFGNPSIIFLLKAGYFRSETENPPTITILSKKTFKRSAGHVGCNFDKVAKFFDTKSGISSLNDQKAWAKLLHSKGTS